VEIIQIVPRLPPVIDGLGDHAYLLADELDRLHDIRTHFVVGAPEHGSDCGSDRFPARAIPRRTAQSLLAVLEQLSSRSATVLLHYVGYGYARRGCPFWLVNALERWRRSSDRRRLMTTFYEICASGPPWTNSFWTSHFQKGLVRRLIYISDYCRTNMQMYKRLLQSISAPNELRASVMPVFSNVGELARPKPVKERQRRMVVFGGAGWRASIYRKHLPKLIQMFHRLDMHELIDVGPTIGVKPKLSVPFSQRGPVNAQQASALLSDTMIGALNYPAAYLAKSTIFSAYAAHGVAPLLLDPLDERNEDGLEAGREYVSGRGATEPPRLSAVGLAAHSWYSDHSLARSAVAYAQMLRRNAACAD